MKGGLFFVWFNRVSVPLILGPFGGSRVETTYHRFLRSESVSAQQAAKRVEAWRNGGVFLGPLLVGKTRGDWPINVWSEMYENLFWMALKKYMGLLGVVITGVVRTLLIEVISHHLYPFIAIGSGPTLYWLGGLLRTRGKSGDCFPRNSGQRRKKSLVRLPVQTNSHKNVKPPFPTDRLVRLPPFHASSRFSPFMRTRNSWTIQNYCQVPNVVVPGFVVKKCIGIQLGCLRIFRMQKQKNGDEMMMTHKKHSKGEGKWTPLENHSFQRSFIKLILNASLTHPPEIFRVTYIYMAFSKQQGPNRTFGIVLCMAGQPTPPPKRTRIRTKAWILYIYIYIGLISWGGGTLRGGWVDL